MALRKHHVVRPLRLGFDQPFVAQLIGFDEVSYDGFKQFAIHSVDEKIWRQHVRTVEVLRFGLGFGDKSRKRTERHLNCEELYQGHGPLPKSQGVPKARA